MASFLRNLLSVGRRPAINATRTIHWLDTTPVDSTDVPCTIQSLDVRVRVYGIYAEVTQTMVVTNPNKRPLSVSVTIPLPDRATVCGYALDVDGQMVDGVVVPKEQARVVFETEQRRGADPGLVESVRGNVYNTRVYPIPGQGNRTIRLRYVAPLLVDNSGAALVDLPMPEEHLVKRMLRIDVEATDAEPKVEGLKGAETHVTANTWSIECEELDFTPTESVRVSVPALPSPLALLERDDSGTVWFSISQAESDAPAREPKPITNLTVMWDASGSRAGINHDRELELLRNYCADSSISALQLIAFADRVHATIPCATADELLKHIEALRYDGATNFEALAKTMGELAKEQHTDAVTHAYLLFTDGIDTINDAPLQLHSACNVIAIVSGQQRDIESVRQACKGLAFDAASAPADARELARALDRDNPNRYLDIRGEGIADVLDASIAGGRRKAAIGKLTKDEATISLGENGPVFVLSSDNARQGNVLASAWAARRVSMLASHAAENADELLSLGRRFGVVSPATSLLVLETLDQWLEHDIEPPATLPEMHAAWKRAQEGKMNLAAGEEEEAKQHRSQLAREWARLREWHAHEFGNPPLEQDTESQSTCPHCGYAIDTDSRFCPHCGHTVAARTSLTGQVSYQNYASAPNAAAPEMERFAAMPRMQGSFAPDSEPGAEGLLLLDDLALSESGAASSDDSGEQSQPARLVTIRPWMPDAPYLKALDAASGKDPQSAREAYFDQRKEFSDVPSFFLDCANWFIVHDDEEFGVSVLSNLAELHIEDEALVRVMGWRLREAGRLEQALSVFRRVLKLRSEDSQSYRDVALVLSELARVSFSAGNEDAARAFAQEAGELYRKIALTPWARRPMAISLFAVEEYNVMRAWSQAQKWKTAPVLEPLGRDLEGVLDCDLRVTLAWDADETDVDLHVTEPSGEEAYYGNRLTFFGGRVSEDITDGFGPELYEIRKAEEGVYEIRAHYYASHQQTIFGPATCTLTVYTDWGRPEQTQRITSTRLDKERQMIPVGTAAYGKSAVNAEAGGSEGGGENEPLDYSALLGASEDELIGLLGEPAERSPYEDKVLIWGIAGGRKLEVELEDGKVKRIAESMPWGERAVLAQ